MGELLSITDADVDATGVSLSIEGSESRVWQLSRARAVELANDVEFQKLIGAQLNRSLPTTEEEMDAVAADARAINGRANQVYPNIDSADLSAAWHAVIDAYRKPQEPQS